MQNSVDNVETVRGGYAAFAAMDIPSVLAVLSPDIEWVIPGPERLAGVSRGHAQVGEFFGRIAEAYTALEVLPEEYLTDGDRVVALGRHRGSAPGGSFEVGFAHVWTVADGQATHFHEYTDTETLGRALG